MSSDNCLKIQMGVNPATNIWKFNRASNVWQQMSENSNKRQLSGNKCLKIQTGVKCLASNFWRQTSETPKRESNVLASNVTVVKYLDTKNIEVKHLVSNVLATNIFYVKELDSKHLCYFCKRVQDWFGHLYIIILPEIMMPSSFFKPWEPLNISYNTHTNDVHVWNLTKFFLPLRFLTG